MRAAAPDPAMARVVHLIQTAPYSRPDRAQAVEGAVSREATLVH